MVRARSGFCDAEGFALDVDTSGRTTLVVEVLEVEGSEKALPLRWPLVLSRHVRRRLSRESIHTSLSNLTASWLLPGCCLTAWLLHGCLAAYWLLSG